MKEYIYTDEDCADLFEQIFKVANWKWGFEKIYPTKEKILNIMNKLREDCEHTKEMASCGRITAIWDDDLKNVQFYFDMYTQ